MEKTTVHTMAAGTQQDYSHVKKLGAAARVAAQRLQTATTAERRAALEGYKQGLLQFREDIEKANTEDLKAAAAALVSGDLAESLYRRLDCRGPKFLSLIEGLEKLISMSPDPVGRCDMATELSENLHLYRITCPIGVIAVIYEARPEVAVQIAGLALKTGNSVILKGGKEASRTNKAIFRALRWGLTHSNEISDINNNHDIPHTTISDANALQRSVRNEIFSSHHAKPCPDMYPVPAAREVSSHEILGATTASEERTGAFTTGMDGTSNNFDGKTRIAELRKDCQGPCDACTESPGDTKTADEAHLVSSNISVECLQMIEEREEVAELLTLNECVDLVIPRGSKSLVQYVKSHTKIPVLGHADGLCSLYVDNGADVGKAVRLILDSKLQYPAACNAIETLLVHREVATQLLPALAKAAVATPLKFKADRVALPLLLSGLAADAACIEDAAKESAAAEHKAGRAEAAGGKSPVEQRDVAERVVLAGEADFATEWLAPILAVKTVNSLKEAIDHINTHGSHHTDCIVTESYDAAEVFLRSVDSANVYHNCSTRFADGYRYGFGAEVGISTNRIHARGPVGAEGLLTYKYRLYGKGHTVGDVAKGATRFTHRDLKATGKAQGCEHGLDSVEDVVKKQRRF